jgi:hypothetical protein
MNGRPSRWPGTQERLIKVLITLGRQLLLSPMARQPNNPSRRNPARIHPANKRMILIRWFRVGRSIIPFTQNGHRTQWKNPIAIMFHSVASSLCFLN